MKRILSVRAAVAALIALGAVACGDDDSPTGNGGLDFPELSAAVRDAFCVRSNATAGDTRQGAIATTDCDADDVEPGDEGYFEVYVVKVATNRNVTFTVSSTFDSYLTLLRLDSFTATTANVTFLDDDDDSAGNLDARLTFALQAGTNYVIAVAGFDYTQTGTYSLTIQ